MKKLSMNDKNLLAEAYRRFNFKNDNKPLAYALLGLGYQSEYKKSKYFKPLHSTMLSARCLSWWVLTDKGVKIMESIIEKNTWKKEYNEKIFNGDISMIAFQ